MATTLVRNGTIVTASDRYEADLYIDNGTISLIGRRLPQPADTVVDAAGKLVLPGGIDVHTHLDMPFGGTTSSDDFETGTIAAAHGGTTTLIDFAIQEFGQGLYPAYEGWMRRAEGKAVIDYAFHVIVRELTDQVSIDMDRLVREEGITSFKLFMAYPGVFMVDDATIFRALLKTRENGGLICMHAENGGVIDTLAKEALRKGQRAGGSSGGSPGRRWCPDRRRRAPPCTTPVQPRTPSAACAARRAICTSSSPRPPIRASRTPTSRRRA
jgi:dihydropyrimidinase